MTTLLLDASVLLAAFDPEDDHHEAARTLLEDDEATLATLDLARYEVANVAVRAWRAPETVAPLLSSIERIGDDGGVLNSTETLLARAAELAEREAISVYDAAYAVAADEGGHRLISCDERDLVSKGLAERPENQIDAAIERGRAALADLGNSESAELISKERHTHDTRDQRR